MVEFINDVSLLAQALANVDAEMPRVKKVTRVVANFKGNAYTPIEQFGEGVETVIIPSSLNNIPARLLPSANLVKKDLVITNRVYTTNPHALDSFLFTDGIDLWLMNATNAIMDFSRYMTELEIGDVLQDKIPMLVRDVLEVKDKSSTFLSKSSFATVPQPPTSGSEWRKEELSEQKIKALGTATGVPMGVFVNTGSSTQNVTVGPFNVKLDFDEVMKQLNPNFFPASLNTPMAKWQYFFNSGATLDFQFDFIAPNFLTVHRPADPKTGNAAAVIGLSATYKSPYLEQSSNFSSTAIADPFGQGAKVWRGVMPFSLFMGSATPKYNLVSLQPDIRIGFGDPEAVRLKQPMTAISIRNAKFIVKWAKTFSEIYVKRSEFNALEKRVADLGG